MKAYEKYNPASFMESGFYVDGDKIADVHKTSFGSIASVICFDCIFTYYVNKVCSRNVDTLLVPGCDWRSILSYNTRDVEFRAVENGVNLILTTYSHLGLNISSMPKFLQKV